MKVYHVFGSMFGLRYHHATFADDSDAVPDKVGVYVWKGEIEARFDEDELPEWIELRGATRTAWPEDLGRLMGKHDPLPEEEGRS